MCPGEGNQYGKRPQGQGQWLRLLVLFSLEKRLRGGPIIVYNFPKDSSGVGGANLLSGDQQWDARKWNGAASGVLLMGPFQLELFFDSKVLLG